MTQPTLPPPSSDVPAPSRKQFAVRIALFASLVALVVVFYATGWWRHLTLENAQENIQRWRGHAREAPWTTIAVVFGIYVGLTTLSLPAAGVMTLLCGALFDRLLGIAVASSASTVGAALAFLATRYLFRNWVRRHFAARLRPIDEGVARDGAWYLLTLRLLPVVPFFLINLGMALTPMRLGVFVLISWLGMLPACAVFVNAGKALEQVHHPSDVLTPAILGSFALLAVLPLLLRFAVSRLWGKAPLTPGEGPLTPPAASPTGGS